MYTQRQKQRLLESDWDCFKDGDTLENNDFENEVTILKDNIVKVRTTKEYSFRGVKLIHTQDENKEFFRIVCHDNELTADEAKMFANIIQDIYREEDNDGGHQVREGNSDC